MTEISRDIITEFIKPMYLLLITASAIMFFSFSFQLFKENQDLKKRLGR